MLSKKILLICGILSSLLYLAMNVITAMLYEGYSSFSQTVSELSAIDAPTRPLWVWLAMVYSMLVIAFAWGVRQSADGSRHLRIAGALIMADAIIGLFWPPMHQRVVLAAGGGTLSDILHIVFTFATVPLMVFAIAFAAAAFGKPFRRYSIATVVVLILFGILTGMDSPKLEANLPTPWMGVWERITIGAYMLWVIVLAILLMQKETASGSVPVKLSPTHP